MLVSFSGCKGTLYNRVDNYIKKKGDNTIKRIVFVKDNQIVYQEDEIAVETAHKVTFDTDQYYFTPETAVFEVRRIDSENNGIIYFLSPTKKK